MVKADKYAFPSYDQDVQAKRESTTFLQDFLIAERFGMAGVKETFRTAFRNWKDNCKYLVELTVVLNKLCWYANERGKSELSWWYADRYYECKDWAFRDDTAFTKDELTFFYDVID